jgi:hypothetical protein
MLDGSFHLLSLEKTEGHGPCHPYPTLWDILLHVILHISTNGNYVVGCS